MIGTLSAVAAACGVGATFSVATSAAAEVANPDYQIKLRLSEAAIDELGEPSQEFWDLFGSQSAKKKEDSESSVYFDTQDRLYSQQGWSIRLRHKETSDDVDVTYKKRIPLPDNSLSKESVADGLQEARKQNFDASDDNYDAQVNSSYRTSTVDFSVKKTAPCPTKDCDVTSGQDTLKILQNLEPGKMTKAMGTTVDRTRPLASAPVEQSTWRVEIAGIKTDLEVSTFGGKRWVEISEEETSRKDALTKRTALVKELDKRGFLLHDDAFKTGAVLETLHGK